MVMAMATSAFAEWFLQQALLRHCHKGHGTSLTRVVDEAVAL